jgi:hypothetical protein
MTIRARRQLISELTGQGSLAHLAFAVKLMIGNARLDGWTGDEDEIGILNVMQTARTHDQADRVPISRGRNDRSAPGEPGSDDHA